MDSVETLETLVDQIKRGNAEEDPNLVINSLESISLLADQMRKSATSKEDEKTQKEVLDNLQNSTFSKVAISKSPVFVELTEGEYNAFKNRLYNKEESEDVLESVGGIDVKTNEQKGAIVQKIDSNLLNGITIKRIETRAPKRLCELTKEEFELLKQEIAMQKNTVSFKSFMDSVRKEWQISTGAMPKMNERQQVDLKDVLVEKRVLNGVEISSKQAHKKTSFMRKTGAEISQFKIKLLNVIEKIKRSIMLDYNSTEEKPELVKAK